jgi:hypothetical protein
VRNPKVRNRKGQSIRGIRPRQSIKPKHRFHHQGDLSLVGGTSTHNGTFHERWRILTNWNKSARQYQKHNTSRMAQLGSGLGVFMKEQ